MTSALPRTILVTGAAGFIGSALSKRLLSEGCRVIGIDDFNSYYPVELKEARRGYRSEPGFYARARGYQR